MEKARMGKIALEVLKFFVRESGFKLRPNEIRRRIGNVSKATGIPKDELKEFGRIVARELLDESFLSRK